MDNHEFQLEVVERLARTETKLDAALETLADHKARIGEIEDGGKKRAGLMAALSAVVSFITSVLKG